GAHDGFDEIPLFSLVPQVADALSVPVIAAGGIVDARGVAAAMSLGAEGVQLGTCFVAAEECIAHPSYKQAIIDAKDEDTVITCRRMIPTRSLKTTFSVSLLELDKAGASAKEIRDFLGHSRARTGQLEGDLDNGEAYCGASAGLIKEIRPAARIVRRLARDYQAVINRIS
ncbi:MAG: nitronate monooxygenase, partial [Deltaproteobacteria bacterium]|nr:nitronate monooxygenase [Deltaproteobacteria bacterium]